MVNVMIKQKQLLLLLLKEGEREEAYRRKGK